MAIKPWLQKTFLWRTKSTDIDYPPKRKKPWLGGSFPELEQFHYGNYPLPWDPDGDTTPGGVASDVGGPPWDTPPGGPPDPGLPRPPGCAGRTLRLFSDADCQGLGILVTGVVGTLRIESGFNLSPCTNGEDVEISGGDLSIPDDCCFNGDTIDFWYCDDCGCGYAIVNIPDCDNNCDPVPYVDGSDEILKNDSKQYTLINKNGAVTWSVSGTGATITQTGLLTTINACGVIVVTATDSCCGVFNKSVRVTDGGYWTQIAAAYSDNCYSTGCLLSNVTCTQGAYKYDSTWRVKETGGYCHDADVDTGCNSRPGSVGSCAWAGEDVYLDFGTIWLWSCTP